MTTATTLAPAAPIETVTPISPAEAFRLGRLLYPKRATGVYFDGEGVCALGAIWAGYGYDPDQCHGIGVSRLLASDPLERARRWREVSEANDGGVPDDEIARRLEEWS